MKRSNRPLWKIVPPKVQDKVARLWSDPQDVSKYLCELVDRTLHSRRELQAAAAQVPGAERWSHPRIEADTDLARVYAVAAWVCYR